MLLMSLPHSLLPRPPTAPAQVSIPIQNSRSADFSTTYLSQGLRVARGSTGNLFLFRRSPPAAGSAA